MSAGGSMVQQLEQEGSHHIVWDLGKKSPLTFLQVTKVRAWLREQSFDVLHLRSRMPAWVVYLAWKGMPAESRPRLVSTVHGLYSVSAYSKIMCVGERVIAVSQAAKDYIENNYPGVDLGKVRTIPRGIDPAEYYHRYTPSAAWFDSWQREYPELVGKTIITLPGRLTRLKGHMDFLAILVELRRQGFEKVHGLVVGGIDPKRKSYYDDLQQAVLDLGLKDNITFTGARSDLRDIMAASDVCVSLSTQPESFGRTVLEALALGRPVVAYDHGGVSEIMKTLFPEGLVPLGDQAAAVKALTHVLASDSKPKTEHPFTKQAMLSAILDVYKALLS
jgi:glycosyltransferase involved in cell wall biosynthesis